MHGAALLLTPFLLGAGARPPDAGPGSAEAVAERLVRATEAERQRLVGSPEFESIDVARALLALGAKATQDADLPRALRAFETAETSARSVGADREVRAALVGAANVLYVQGQYDRALASAEGSLRVGGAGGPAEQAEAWNSIGHVKHARGEYDEAARSYEKAEQLWTSAGDRRGVARAQNNIGNVHRARAEFDEALIRYQQALGVFEELGDRRSAAVVTNTIGSVHFYRGEYRAAIEHCTRSMAMKEELGDRYGVAASLDTLGHVYRGQGAYSRALHSFHRSLKLRQEIGDPFASAETWNNIGLVHFSQGDYRLAIDAYKHGLRLSAQLGGTSLTAEGLYNIAAAAWRLGERRRAEANYRESLRISERVGYKGTAAANLHDLGRMALEAGRHEEAGALLQRALGAREALKDQAGTAETLHGLGALRLAQGRSTDALVLSRRAVEIARRIEQPELHWEAETLSGLAYRSLGQSDAAAGSFNEAVRVIEGLRLQIVGRTQGRERFFESKLSPYHELMTLALSKREAGEALELAERFKARALADLMTGRADVTRAMTEEERRQESRLRAALVSVNEKILAERQRQAPDARLLASLDADLQSRRSAFEAFEAAMHAQHPELKVGRGATAPFRMSDAANLIADASVAILEYVVTEQTSHLFVLTSEYGRAHLASYPIRTGRPAMARQVRQLRSRLAGREIAFADDARRLHDVLLAPAGARLRGKSHLVIVPDGPLWDVPFQALQDPTGRYLIESAAVSYAPSLTVLRETLRRPARSGLPSLLAMGKAEFGGAHARTSPALMSDLGPLPDAERQVQAIATLYEPERRAIWLGAEAREDRFKSEAPRHSVLHLATHGVLDQASPLYSHVVLSPGSGGSSEDGLLEAWELLDLELDADLVILSACETGRGRIAPGEGIVGTMWAFFVAGSRSLLVSQWKVESTSTTELMTAFHRGLAPGGGDKAAYLRQASLELLRQPRYAHPFYWAGFVLVGDPY